MGDEFDVAAPVVHQSPTVAAPVAHTAPRVIVQTKLQVGAADDRYEVEADRAAAAVMRRLSTVVVGDPGHVAEPAGEMTDAGSAPAAARLVQMKASLVEVDAAGGALDAGTEREIQQASGGGAAMAPQVQRLMEHGFGADFSSVRIHDDGQADDLSRRIQARAFTTGNDVFFQRSQYNPATTSGQQLLAHELAHVVQQGGARTRPEGVARSIATDLRVAPKGAPIRRTLDEAHQMLSEVYFARMRPMHDMASTLVLQGVPKGEAWVMAGVVQAYTGMTKVDAQILNILRKHGLPGPLQVAARQNMGEVHQYMQARADNNQHAVQDPDLDLAADLLTRALQMMPGVLVAAPKPPQEGQPAPMRTFTRCIEDADATRGTQPVSGLQVGAAYTAPATLSFSEGAPAGGYENRAYRLIVQVPAHTGEKGVAQTSAAIKSIFGLNAEQREVLVPAGTQFTVSARQPVNAQVTAITLTPVGPQYE